MPWRGPQFEGELPSLGWILLEWWADYLPSPRDPESPLIFTDEQARLLVDWYSIHPVTGRFVYRRGVSRRSKGWGKSPVEAAKAIAELAGPVRFDGWSAAGEPVGRPWGVKGDPSAWVQIGACSEDQTENTHSVVYEFLTANDGKAADELKIDAGLTRSYLRDGHRHGKLEPVTAAAGSREGQPVTYGVLDETHLWRSSNGGVKLARTLRRNVAKMDGRSYETTNSFEPGAGSVAEQSHKAAAKGAAGVFYDAVEAPPLELETASDAEVRAGLAVAYGDAAKDRGGWVDLDRLVLDARDPDTPREDVERFFFNWNRASTGRAVDPKRWAELYNEERKGIPAPPGSYIGVGFDGSISGDATILRGCLPPNEDGTTYSWIIGKWIRPTDPKTSRKMEGWHVPRLEVKAAVERTFTTFRVGRMLCDPPKWWTEIEEWAERYGEEVVLAFDTNSDRRMAPAVDRWLNAIELKTHTHDGDPDTNDHVRNAHKRKARIKDDDDDNRTLYTLTKGDGDERGLIDAAVCEVLAHEAACAMPEEPAVNESFFLFS